MGDDTRSGSDCFDFWATIVVHPSISKAGGRRFSIELNCLKWGFVIMIIGDIYSQKCNENAKEKRLMYFELWFYFAFKWKQKWNQQIINKKKF